MIPVLYVDDESGLLDITKIYLEQTGAITVDTARSASEAFDLLKSRRYDAVVSDYQMPVMDGIAFLRELRKKYPKLPFIIFTGRGREEIVIQAFDSGADFYLQKGGDPTPQFAELARKITTIVEQRKAADRVLVLNRLYSMLSSINHAIIHRKDVDQLMAEVCRIAIGTGGFRMAWAGRLNPDTRIIEPFQSCGVVEGYFATMAISAEDVAKGRGPTGTAFRTGRTDIINDLATDPRMEPWREEALKRGYRAIASFPYAMGTKYAGTFTLYAPGPGFFDPEILALLNEVADDISFSFRSMALEEEHVSLFEKIKRNEEKFRNIFDALPELIVSINLAGIITDCNKQVRGILGYGKEEIVGKPLTLLVHTDFEAGALAFLGDLRDATTPLSARLRLVKKDGGIVDANISSSGLRDPKGIVFRKVWVIEDITARLRMEEELACKRGESGPGAAEKKG